MATPAQYLDKLSGTALQRVDRLADDIVTGGDEAQELRRLPDWLVDRLIDEGFFRFTLPPELGGEDATTLETIEVLEAISAIDASVGWNVMLGSEINAMAAGGMPKELAKEVYIDNPNVVMCGGGGPGSQPSYAIEQDDGSYKVWGKPPSSAAATTPPGASWARPSSTTASRAWTTTACPSSRCGFCTAPSGKSSTRGT